MFCSSWYHKQHSKDYLRAWVSRAAPPKGMSLVDFVHIADVSQISFPVAWVSHHHCKFGRAKNVKKNATNSQRSSLQIWKWVAVSQNRSSIIHETWRPTKATNQRDKAGEVCTMKLMPLDNVWMPQYSKSKKRKKECNKQANKDHNHHFRSVTLWIEQTTGSRSIFNFEGFPKLKYLTL